MEAGGCNTRHATLGDSNSVTQTLSTDTRIDGLTAESTKSGTS